MLVPVRLTSILQALLILISVSACMQKPTATKAKCGEYEAFDSVSRSCYSLSTHPQAPRGNLTSVSLEAENAKRVKLTYTDINGDLALSCKVTPAPESISSILTISPAISDGTYAHNLNEIKNAMTNLYFALPGGYGFTSDANVNLLAVSAIYSSVYQSYNVNNIKANSLLVRSHVDSMIANAQDGLTIIGAGHSYFVQVRANLMNLMSMREEFDLVLTSMANNCVCNGGECYTDLVPRIGFHGEGGFSYTLTDKDGVSASRPVRVSVSPLDPQRNSLRPIAESMHYEVNEDGANLQIAQPYAGLDAGVGRNLYAYQTTNFTYKFEGPKVGCTALGCYGQSNKGARVSKCFDLIGSDGPFDRSCTYTPINNNVNNFDPALVPALQVSLEASSTIDFILFKAHKKGEYGNQVQLQFIDIKSLSVKDYDDLAKKEQLFGLVDATKGESYIRVEGNRIKVFLNQGMTLREDVVALINAHPLAARLVSASLNPINNGLSNAVYVTGTMPVNLADGNDGYDHFAYSAHNGTSISLNTNNISISIVPKNDPPQVPSEYCPLYEVGGECNPLRKIVLDEDQAVPEAFDIHFRDVDIDTPRDFEISKKIVEGLCTPDTTGLNINALVNSDHFIMTSPAYPELLSTLDTVSFKTTVTLQADPLRPDFNGHACLYYQVRDGALAFSRVQGVAVYVTPINDAPMLGSYGGLSFVEFNATPTINLTTAFNEDFDGPLNTDHVFTFYSQPGGEGEFENDQTLTLTIASADNSIIDFSKGCAPAEAYLDADFRCYKTLDNSLFSSVTIITNPVPLIVNGTKTLEHKIAFTPKKDKSNDLGVEFSITVGDNGKNGAIAAPLSTTYHFSVIVNYINDPPYFIPAEGENLAIIHSNEGGMIQTFPFRINEDEGDTVSEDFQGISIASITSDNPGLLPWTNITAFYDLNDNGVEDPGEARSIGMGASLETSAADDVKAHRLYLKLRPIAGQAGSSNIVLTVVDSDPLDPKTTSHLFSYVVRPISAIHRGWENISSVGIKTNKNDEPVEVVVDGSKNTLITSDLKCNYNKVEVGANCNFGNCVGTQPPNSLITASSKNLLYWDLDNQRCYRSQAPNSTTWVEFNTSCPVTRQADVCGGKNCIFDEEADFKTNDPDFIGQFMYALDTKTCYRAQDISASSWTEYIPAKVTLSWKAFSITGTGTYLNVGIKGYNIYRREPGRDYDFTKNGHLVDHTSANGMSVSGAVSRTFTDTTAIAGKVYYYIVRPVDSMTGYPTYSSEKFSEVRVLAATENYAFVHRWMVNQEICRGMNLSESSVNPIDPNKNYSCPYVGPGRSINGLGESIYDYGRDLLVDIQEAGCSYAQAPKCSLDGCVGVGAPVSIVDVVEDDLYYDRSNGTCYAYQGLAWKPIDGGAPVTPTSLIANKVNTALNPPLVNISKANAQLYCENRDVPMISGLNVQPSKAILPNKKDYIGYSAHKLSLEYSEAIKGIELGQSLNSESACNGSYANGLAGSFTNADIPSYSNMFTIAGTHSSGIKSLHTGSVPWGLSKSTNQCVSRYGIQDLYGNVAEWVNDGFSCLDKEDILIDDPDDLINIPPNQILVTVPVYICSGIQDDPLDPSPPPSERSFKEFEFGDIGLSKTYAIDGIVGPGPIFAASEPVSFIDQWSLATGAFNASFFSYPLGLPITDAITSYDGVVHPEDFTSTLPFLLRTSSDAKINDDGFVLYRPGVVQDTLEPDPIEKMNPKGIRDVTVGGSFKTDRYPGRFTTELVGEKEALRNDVGFRCAVPVEKTNYPLDPYHNYNY